MKDLSIVVPSIRKDRIAGLLASVGPSIGDYTFEFVVVGPYEELQEDHDWYSVKFISDYGSPSRCIQKAVSLCDGQFIKWSTDDATYFEGVLSECLDLAYKLPKKDVIICKYTEDGPPGEITGADDEYYIAWTHRDQRLAGIPRDFRIAPVAMFDRKYFIEIGGLDCSFEHINMNTHDLAFRVQKDGGFYHFSPSVVMHCNSNNRLDEHKPLDDAHRTNDVPRFMALYSDNSAKDRIKIPYDNWKDSAEMWRRFL